MPEHRTTTKLIRFRPQELARITERTQTCARPVERVIRETALGAIPRPCQDGAADSRNSLPGIRRRRGQT